METAGNIESEIKKSLSVYCASGGQDALSHIVSVGCAMLHAQTICLYWVRPEQWVYASSNTPEVSTRRMLEYSVRCKIWPWLLQQTNLDTGAPLQLPDEMFPADLTQTPAILPMQDQAGKVAGFIVLLMSTMNSRLLNNKYWRQRCGQYAQVLRAQILVDYDEQTGLLCRKAFVEQTIEWSRSQHMEKKAAGYSCSCLLLLQLDLVRQLRANSGATVATRALGEIAALLGTRIRGRDITGRTAADVISLVLKNCNPGNALRVADSLQRTIAEYKYVASAVILGPAISTVVLPLESGLSEQELQQHLRTPKILSSSVVQAVMPEKQANLRPSNVVDMTTRSKPVSDLPRRQTRSIVAPILAEGAEAQLRLQAGVRLDQELTLACYWVRSLAYAGDASEMQCLRILLDGLSSIRVHRRGTVLPVTIVKITAGFLQDNNIEWLISSCHRRYVAPGELCLAISDIAITANLQQHISQLAKLQAEGYQLLLELSVSPAAGSALCRRLPVDYVRPANQLLSAALGCSQKQDILQQQIMAAHAAGARTVCAGIDTDQALAVCRSLEVSVGFGRLCGRSIALNSFVGPG